MYEEATSELEKMLTLQGDRRHPLPIVRRAFQQGGYKEP